ncbi:hypothetical protein vseg_020043 [Gypsophila vaccaria]
MGSVSLKIGDGTAKFKRSTLCSSAVNLMMLFSVVTTNLFALYAFTYHSNSNNNNNNTYSTDNGLRHAVSEIMREIHDSQTQLTRIQHSVLGYDDHTLLDLEPGPAELTEFLRPHALPLGKDARSGMTHLTASVGHTCAKSMGLLSGYMSYKVSGQCPDDLPVAQKLVAHGCEPLPRRRCFSKPVSNVVYPLPRSLWANVRKFSSRFDLGVNGTEARRFVKVSGKNDFAIDGVLGLGGGGGGGRGVRLGFDIAGGGGGSTGTFAARMWERNVTVVTQTLDIDGPYSELVAARGLFPLFISVDHRFPFYDSFFDLVHVGSALGVGGGSKERLEFLLFDIDRVLRAGGLLWVDNFRCVDDEKKRDLTRLIERFGYKKLKWVVGEKVVESGKSEVYLSAVLQKPVRA